MDTTFSHTNSKKGGGMWRDTKWWWYADGQDLKIPIAYTEYSMH